MLAAMARPGEAEIEVLYEEVVDVVSEYGNDSSSLTSAQASFNDGVKCALGWVLGQESRPEIENV
jgi:hypothetical protein